MMIVPRRMFVTVFTVILATAGQASAQGPSDPLSATRTLIEDGEYEQAKTALTQLIGSNPNAARLYALRGFVNALQEDIPAAVADYGHASAIEPANASNYRARAYAEYDMHAWDEAAADLSKAAKLDPDQQGNARLRLWLIQARRGQQAAASRDLAAFVKTYHGTDDSQWISTVALFLTDQMSESAFMSLLQAGGPGAQDREKYPAAYFFAGAKRSLAGDQAAAADWFKQCITLGLDDDSHLDAVSNILSARAELYGIAQSASSVAPAQSTVRLDATAFSQLQITKNVSPRRPRFTSTGVVAVDAAIDAAGKVRAVSVRNGSPALQMVALDAVSQWEFAPPRINGSITPVIATIRVNFTCDEGGFAAACTDLGVRYEIGRAVPRDLVRAAILYQRGCGGDDALGCARLGMLYASGNGVPQDDLTALRFLRQGCDGGTPIGCEALGSMYAAGNGVPKNGAMALTLYTRACDAGDVHACSLKETLQSTTGKTP